MARLGATVVVCALLVLVLACSLSACDAARPKGFVTPKKVGRFMKWFREEGGHMHDSLKVVVERMPLGHGSMIEDEFVHPQVRVVVKDDGQAVQKGQVLVKTPAHLIIHPGLVSDSKLPQQDFDDKERLAYFVAEEARDVSSQWRRYWDVLPREFNTPLHYSSEERSMLSDSVTQYGHAAMVAREERKAFDVFKAKVNRLQPSPLRKFDSYSVATLRWAWSVVTSRGFLVPHALTDDNSFSDRPCLVPGSDFFNHRSGRKKVIRVKDGLFEMQSLQKDIGPGKEVFVNYHNMPNAWLLSLYGFVPAQNPHDFLPVRLDMPYMMGTELENMRVHLLEELGLSQSVEVTKAGLTKRLENLARVCGLNTFISEEMRDEWIELDMDKDDIPVSDITAARGLELMRRAVDVLVERYRQHDVYVEISESDEYRGINAPEIFRRDDRFGWSRNMVMAAKARRMELDLLKNLERAISKRKAALGVNFDLDAELAAQADPKDALPTPEYEF